jgi:acyl-CoA reductase-like NAD-dependent aldehyde dehydrogenase
VGGCHGLRAGAHALHRVADACQRRRDELARALTLDQGKPLRAEAYPEVDDLIGYWRDAAEDVLRLDGAIPPSRLPGARVLIERRPLGVVAVITPWNWPYTMPAQVIAPALAAGNTVVWAPAPSTSVCSAVLVDAIADAGLPPGAVTFLPGPGPVVGDEIAGHPGVAAVAFVGSTQTGLSVARRAAGKAQLLEMGNNGPLVVMDDADLDRAVAGTLAGAYLCSGQSCTAAERILVHERVHDAFVAALAAAVASLEDAITLTDDLPYGLMASIYTADAGTGLRYADAVRAAWVNINESSNYWETHLPFGGGGGSASGVGRVGGRYALEALSQVRTIVLSGLS